MPLDAAALKQARFDISANKYLGPVWQAVDTYNRTGRRNNIGALADRFDQFRSRGDFRQPSELTERAQALQQIMQLAAGYLTCKPPGTKQTRNERWDAMTKLMENVSQEAYDLGVKLVDGPNDFRTISGAAPSVWLEVTDPRHRNFASISEVYSEWLNDDGAIRNKTSFWKWAGDKATDYTVQYDQSAKYFVERGASGKLLNIDGHKVDTQNVSSHKGGKGLGIFAIDTEMRLYIGTHNDAQGEDLSVVTRHVSLTGGRPILAAGEICVVNGEVRMVNNQTGHYKVLSQTFLNHIGRNATIPPEAVVAFVSLSDTSALLASTVGDLRIGNAALLDKDSAKLLVPEVEWDNLASAKPSYLGHPSPFVEEAKDAFEEAAARADEST